MPIQFFSVMLNIVGYFQNFQWSHIGEQKVYVIFWLGQKLLRNRFPLVVGGCNGRSDCQVCNYIICDTHFSSKVTSRSFEIRGGPFHCNSSNVIYLLECKTCLIQYVGSTGTDGGHTKFRHRFNDYKCKHKEFLGRQANCTFHKGKAVSQASLHSHFSQQDHNGPANLLLKLMALTVLKKFEKRNPSGNIK